MSLSQLDAFLKQFGISIDVDPDVPEIGGLPVARLLIKSRGEAIAFIAFDEFGDAREANQALCLELLRREIAELEDASTCEEWARFQSVDPELLAVQRAYEANRKASAQIETSFGALPDVISDLDWQLNAGLAQELRSRD